jgi:hypothetical protein
VTTYAGHAGAFGATHFVEHKIGLVVPSFVEVAAAVHAQGALLSINHPVLNLGDVCIGCAWQHPLDGVEVNGVEIGTGGLLEGALLFESGAISFWEQLLSQGRHVAAVGGSDDHQAGKGTGRLASPIGDPTTLILADELSVAALKAALGAGRTVVKLQGPGDPMVELSAGDQGVGDTLAVRSAVLSARVSGGMGNSVRFVKNGTPSDAVVIDSDPFLLTQDAIAPSAGLVADGTVAEDRWRVEVMVDNLPRTVSSHLYIRLDPSGPDPVGDRNLPGSGCAISAPRAFGSPLFLCLVGFLGAALATLQRRRQKSAEPA